MHGRIALILAAVAALEAQQFPTFEGRQRDLDFVLNTVVARHPDFFFQLDRARFQQSADTLRANAATFTGAQFYVGLTQLVAMANDPHTALSTSGSLFRILPLRVRWFEDGIFVTRATEAYAKALGTRLIRIGDMPVEDVIAKLATLIPHVNDAWVRHGVPGLVVNQTVLEGLGIVDAAPASTFTFRALDGREFTLAVEASSATPQPAVREDRGPIPAYQQKGTDNYWYSYLPADRLLYFRYNFCQDMAGNPFTTFAADLLATLDSNPVDTMVFDYRDNGGGGSAVIAPLFNGLASRFARLSANPAFRIYDVFNDGTFSSAMLNAADLKLPYPSSIPNPNTSVNLSTRVVSIGMPSGGPPSGYGQVTQFALPASGIGGQYSTKYIRMPSGIPDLPSLMPDVAVDLRSTDYFSRTDPVMETILARGSGAPPAPSGAATVVNAASFRVTQGVAPGSFAAAFGTFTKAPDEVLVAGRAAQVLSAAASQVNFVVPAETPVGRAAVSVRAAGVELASGSATISESGPGLFVLAPADPSQPGAVLNQDGSVNGAASPAAAGEIVQIFATGYSAAATRVYFGETLAEVLFSGPLAEFPGLWQINARLPAGVSGQVPVFVTAGGLASNGVTIAVR